MESAAVEDGLLLGLGSATRVHRAEQFLYNLQPIQGTVHSDISGKHFGQKDGLKYHRQTILNQPFLL